MGDQEPPMSETSSPKLEDLKPGASIEGLTSAGPAKIVNIEWFGDQAVKVIFEDSDGAVQDRLIYRDEECYGIGNRKVVPKPSSQLSSRIYLPSRMKLV